MMAEAITLSSIPHRPPFRFVDEIVEVTDDRILAFAKVDPEADFFRGHYPGQPVMPGVLLCEAAFQAGALLIAHKLGSIREDKSVPVVTRIQDAKFKRMVKPGDRLDIEVQLDDQLEEAYFLTGRVRVGGAIALRVTFACMMAPVEPS